MEAIDYSYLLGAGILMIGLEALFFSFFLFWMGIGFVIVAILSYFGLFDNGIAQIATALAIGTALLFLFRKKSMEWINKSTKEGEEQVHTGGTGVVDNGMIKMDGTYWQSDDDLSDFKDGDKVEIEIINNRAVLKS